MTISQQTLDWLMAEDPAIARLTAKYLINNPLPYTEDGLLSELLNRFDYENGLWGGGVYSPKWISTHYTLLDLMSLEVDPQHPYFQKGLQTILNEYWHDSLKPKKGVGQDHCVLGMAVNLMAYGQLRDPRLHEIVGYLIDHTQPDGGWNCDWNSKGRPSKKSSLHTTLTFLEAMATYLEVASSDSTFAPETLVKRVNEAIPAGQNFILNKRIFLKETNGEIIDGKFLIPHFPTRWKYDYLRALLYFAQVGQLDDIRLKPALDHLKSQLKEEKMPKGTTHTGLTHVNFEAKGIGGRFNTLRAWRVLKDL